MKNWKKMLSIVVVALTSISFVACGDDEDNKKEERDVINTSSWVGNMTVNPEGFQLNDLEIKTTCTSKTKTCKIEMNQVKFASAMPHQLNIIIDGIDFSVNDGDTILSGANIASQYLREGELADAGYQVASINGKISNGKLTVNVDGSYRGSMQINFAYEGTRK